MLRLPPFARTGASLTPRPPSLYASRFLPLVCVPRPSHPTVSSPCGTDVDHAIVLEGYGTDSATGLDYYLVRNSWSASWGEQGYIRIARYGQTAKGEPCAEDTTPGDGDGCKGGPGKIQVRVRFVDIRDRSTCDALRLGVRSVHSPPPSLPRPAPFLRHVCGLCGILSDTSYATGGYLL